MEDLEERSKARRQEEGIHQKKKSIKWLHKKKKFTYLSQKEGEVRSWVDTMLLEVWQKKSKDVYDQKRR